MTRRQRTGMRNLGTTRGDAYPAQINIRLTDDDLAALHDACLRLQSTASAFGRMAIEAQLQTLGVETQ